MKELHSRAAVFSFFATVFWHYGWKRFSMNLPLAVPCTKLARMVLAHKRDNVDQLYIF